MADWKISDDKLTYTSRARRPEVADGAPVTAEIAWLAEALGQERQYGPEADGFHRQHEATDAKTIAETEKTLRLGAESIGKPSSRRSCRSEWRKRRRASDQEQIGSGPSSSWLRIPARREGGREKTRLCAAQGAGELTSGAGVVRRSIASSEQAEGRPR